MKLVVIIMILTLTHVSGSSFSQTITYTGKGVTLEKVLKVVESQTGYNLFYKYNEEIMSKPLHVNFVNTELKAVLEEILVKNGLKYSLNNKTITINRPTAVQDRSAKGLEQQEQVLKGIVVDKTTGETLVGATIRVKGGSQGVASNDKGEFTLKNVKSGATIVVGYTGYRTQEVLVRNQQTIRIALESEQGSLDEVVVTGYQNIDKRTFTGSVGKVKPEDMATAGTGDVGKALQGMVAGVAVENTSSTFGTKSKIRIRGNSSISGNQEPLWVIDGVVLDDAVNINPNQLYSGDASTMLSSAISGINPDDIEDIQILKDASATAMYGTQAVNGVIVVTTKKGKVGTADINYKNTFTLNVKPSITSFNVMNSKERMEFSEELYQKNLVDFTNMNRTYGAYGKLLEQMSMKEITWDQFYDRIERAKTYNTDWFDVLFRNNLTQEHSLSMSAGVDKFQVYTSGSFFKDHGQVVGQNTDRYTANIRTNYNVSDKVSFTATLNGSLRNQKTFGAYDSKEGVLGLETREFDINPFTFARTTSRAIRPYGDDGSLEWYQTNYAPFNILHELENNFINVKLKEFRFQFDANWKIRNDLKYTGLASARTTAAYSEHIATEFSNVAESYRAMANSSVIWGNDKLYNDPYDLYEFPISVLPQGGIVVVDNTDGTFYTVRNSLNYTPRFERHSFDLLVGNEIRSKQYYKDYYKGYGFDYFRGMTSNPDYRAIMRDILSLSSDPYYKKGQNTYNEVSFFGNLAYSYKGKYNLTASIRSDGSNRLGASQKFRFLPIWVLGGSWNADEDFNLENVSWLDQLKLRGSYGLRGNISGLGSPEMLAYYSNTVRFDPSTVENLITIDAPDNPSMQWEKEKMINAAIEFGFLKRFNFIIEYYHRDNYDLISAIEVSRATGFQRKTINWADMTNQGLEITFNSHNIKKENFDWKTVFTFGYNKNTIKSLQTNNTILQQTIDRGAPMVGRPVNGLYSFEFAGLTSNGLPLFVDASGKETYRIDKGSRDLDMLVYEGSREPLSSGGLTNSFRYKKLTLSTLFTFNYGNKIRMNSFYKGYYSDIEALDKNLANRWQAPGHEQYTNVPRIIDADTRSTLLGLNSDPFTFYNRSNIRTVDGSFIRFKSVLLNYEIPNYLVKKAGFKKLVLNGQAQNIYLWSDKKLQGQDPESIVSGISLPLTTTYTFGLTCTF
ncbi:SusC/RagA family TonB-linked outer membrane protein [Sphingobacterium paucimobilis]|uniref:TonB-dependent receptor plug domain-containing protein n=1 Tax=Sphingobacterium paucimobilis HER1398 TaxID=1346330 RepID=U2HDP1_9SPHI|nr:SusC/RagA family TonB-linked outer membrane protein [Sphingobacterium paucimobilis]ERJ59886.1 hypothetical protein M472_14030 [Sphingobacterium paucimobilis HER1398]